MSYKHHYVWADIVRSLAVFSVVYIHSRLNIWSREPLSIFSILDISSGICIALFFLLSGALLLPKQETIMLFFRKRLVKIFIPWVFWATVWYIFKYYTLQIPHNDFLNIKNYVVFSLTHYWFLPIIFCMYLFTPLLRLSVVKLKTTILTLLLLLWFFFLIVIPIMLLHQNIYNPSNTLLTIFQFLGIYLLGYIIIDRYKPSGNFLLSGVLFFIGILTIFIEQHFWHTITLARLEAFPYTYITPELLLASTGIFTAIFVLFNTHKKHLNKSLTKLLSTISQTAFGIYLTHGFFILLYDALFAPTFLPLAKTLVVFLLSCLFVIGIKKIPYIKLIMP